MKSNSSLLLALVNGKTTAHAQEALSAGRDKAQITRDLREESRVRQYV